MYECRLRFEVAYEMENVWYEVYSMAEEEKKQGFEKKDIIYSESLGVCKVDDVVKLSQKKGEWQFSVPHLKFEDFSRMIK